MKTYLGQESQVGGNSLCSAYVGYEENSEQRESEVEEAFLTLRLNVTYTAEKSLLSMVVLSRTKRPAIDGGGVL